METINIQIVLTKNKTVKEQLKNLDEVIAHIKKEHGTSHTLSFEIIFEI